MAERTVRLAARRGRLTSRFRQENALGVGGYQDAVTHVGKLGPDLGEPVIRRKLLDRLGQRPLLLAGDVVVCALTVLWGAWYASDYRFSHASFALALLLCLGMAGLYRSRLSLSLLDDLPTVVGHWLIAVGLGVLGQVIFTKLRWGGPLVVDWGALRVATLTLGGILAVRAVSYALVRTVRTRGIVAHRTLIIGTEAAAQQIASVFLAHPQYGLLPVGYLDDEPGPATTERTLPILGRVDELACAVTRHRAHIVVVASSSLTEPDLLDQLRGWNRLHCDVFVVPRLFETHNVSRDSEDIWGIPLVRLRRASYRTMAWSLKRGFDVVFSLLALAVLLPVLLVIALLVRLEGGPGVLFRQERVSVGNATFELLKFRSMRPADETESQTNWNIAQDSRLGPVGKFLRKTSLDELPQLINILRGDMSLVGPRPERPFFVEQFNAANRGYGARHRVPAGLTGWAQVHSLRGDTSIADRARFDNFYIENWSLWLDVKIMLRTASAVVRGTGG